MLCKLAGSSRLSNPPLHKYRIYMYINQTEAFAAVQLTRRLYLNCSVFVLFCCVAFYFLHFIKAGYFIMSHGHRWGSKHKKVFGKMWQTRDLCRRRRRMTGMNA